MDTGTKDMDAALAELERAKAELAEARAAQERHERQWQGLQEISALLDTKPKSDAEDLICLVKDRVAKLLHRDDKLKQALAHHLLIAEALEESRERTQAALDSISTGVLLADPQDGLIVEANAGAASLVGTTTEQLLGTPLEKLLGHASLGQEAAVEFEGELLRADGERIDVLRGSRLIAAGERSYQLETFADITGRDKYRRMLEARSRLLSGLAAAVNNLLRGGDDFESDVRSCMGALGKAADVDRIYLFEDSPGAFQRGTPAKERYRWAEADTPLRPAPDCGVLRAAFCQGEQGAVTFGQFLVAPIFLAGRYRGFMGFETSRQPRRWSTAEVAIVKTAAETFGAAIDLRRAEEELGKALSRSEVMRVEAQDCAIRATEGKMAAEAGTVARTEFLGLISDEMRNPLNGVIGMSDLLRETALSHEQAEYVDTIRESGASLLALIDDVLDFTKAESGELKLKEQAFELAGLLAETTSLLKAGAEEKGLRLDWELAPGCPRSIVGDRARLLQVLHCLGRNAVEFTARGHVSVRAGAAGGLLAFTVEDSGVGIPPSQLGKLFQPLSKLDCSASRQHKGLGLGLALSSRLVKLMGGGMTVESQPGMGSKFMFSIVAQEVGDGRHGDAPPEPDEDGGGLPAEHPPLRILVAEDNKINQRLIALVLAKLGHKPDLVENGQKALDVVAAAKYDIVFMDLHMPGMGGLEAARRIAADIPPERRPVVVAMTANVSQEDRDLCHEAGMVDFIAKPIRPERLRAVLRRWGTRPNEETLVAREIVLDGVEDSLLNPSSVSMLEEMGVLEEMVALFVGDEAPACMAELRRANHKGSLDAVKRAAHSLKGICYHVGADHLAELCKRLEDAAKAKDRQAANTLLETVEEAFAETCEALAKLKGA